MKDKKKIVAGSEACINLPKGCSIGSIWTSLRNGATVQLAQRRLVLPKRNLGGENRMTQKTKTTMIAAEEPEGADSEVTFHRIAALQRRPLSHTGN